MTIMTDKYGHRSFQVRCSECNEFTTKRYDQLSGWHGRCNSCVRKERSEHKKLKVKKRELVSCKKCGDTWEKRTDGMKKWKGFCVKCCQEIKHSTPEQKERCRQHMKSIRVKYGGKMPNQVYSSGANHPLWKGGMPNCVDCGVELSSRAVKRCPTCHHKTKEGENHWNWKGGKSTQNMRIRNSKEYSEWRAGVFKRDGWCCVICGHRSVKKGDIKADHIKPFHLFPELRLNVENGRTLCLTCDYIYGYNHLRDEAKIVNMDFGINKDLCWKTLKTV